MSDASQTDAPSSGEYVVVARRYRPKSFGELVGQQQVSHALSNAIRTNRVGHAYLFTGARGVGKTSTARILAKCLNCVDGPTFEPCGQCDACQSISGGDDVDVLEIDGASNRGIDEIRQLRSNVNIRPSRSRFKIYIIDEVHMLTTAAFNALLKTLEEPPEHVKFIFCTTDPEKIPITVLSRCQRFDFAPVATESILERLRFIVDSEGVKAEDAALRLLARRASGSMRDSQSLLEQLLSFCSEGLHESDVHAMLGTAQSGRLSSIAGKLIDRDAPGALNEIDSAVHEGVDIGQLAEQLLGYLRDMMAAVVGCGPEMMLHAAETEHGELLAAGQRLGLESLLASVQILDHAVSRMRQSTQVRTLVEVALVRICRLDDLDDLSKLIAQVRDGNPLPAPAARSAAPSAPPASSVKKKPVEPLDSSPTRSNSGVPEAEKPAGDTPAANNRSSSPDSSPELRDRPKSLPPKDKSPLSSDVIKRQWRAALAEVGGITEEFGADYESIAISAPNLLVVKLRVAYNKEWCERPDVKRKLEEALSRLTGREMRVDFAHVAEAEVRKPEKRNLAQERAIKRREVEQNSLVQETMQLFDAEIVKIAEPRRG